MSSRRKLSSALIVLLAAALPLTACSSSSEEEASTSSATREFTDAHGTTEVPENPQRVVVLEPLELDTAIALGITPVGAAVANNVTGIPAYLASMESSLSAPFLSQISKRSLLSSPT